MTTSEPVMSSLELRRNERPYFNESAMPEAPTEYVCWLDVMGAESAMRRSHKIAANFVMKLHVAALEANGRVYVEVFPVVDGMYVCSLQLPHMQTYLKNVIIKLALTFLFESRPEHRFLVRGALAYGPVVKGKIAVGASNALQLNSTYSEHVILGIPLVQAYRDETRASPFGIYVHESARSFAPPGGSPLPMTYWRWWLWHQTPDDVVLVKALKQRLEEHLVWCKEHSTSILYARDRIEEHRILCREYFADV